MLYIGLNEVILWYYPLSFIYKEGKSVNPLMDYSLIKFYILYSIIYHIILYYCTCPLPFNIIFNVE